MGNVWKVIEPHGIVIEPDEAVKIFRNGELHSSYSNALVLSRAQCAEIADLIEYLAAEITRLKAERWVTMEFYDDPENRPE